MSEYGINFTFLYHLLSFLSFFLCFQVCVYKKLYFWMPFVFEDKSNYISASCSIVVKTKNELYSIKLRHFYDYYFHIECSSS